MHQTRSSILYAKGAGIIMARAKRTRRPKYIEIPVRDLLECSDGQSLKEEMGEWRDNLDGANMTHLPKYEEVSEAADELDNVVDELESNLSNAITELEKTHAHLLDVHIKVRNRPAKSRADRAGVLQEQIMEAVDYLRGQLPEDHDVRSTLDDIEEGTEAVSMVNYPGMY